MSEQSVLWRGQFGDQYHARSPGSVDANLAFFERALAKAQHISSILELGCGVGTNLRALARLLPATELSGVEINTGAASAASEVADHVWCDSVLDWSPPRQWDLVLTRGVLIHVAPDDLPAAYGVIYEASERYVLLAEYYAKTPTEVQYRGHDKALWRRDFAGEFLDLYSNMRLRDYGFVYDRDDVAPQDSINWFLMERTE